MTVTEIATIDVVDAELVDDAATALAVRQSRLAAPAPLSDSAQQRRRKSKADNTVTAYQRHVVKYETWCLENGHLPYRDDRDGTTLAEWVNALADAGAGKATMKQAIAAVRTAHTMRGLPKPDIEQATEVRDGYFRESTHKRVQRALPLTVHALRAMVKCTENTGAQGLRDRLLLSLGFSILARRSELCALQIGDVAEHEEGLVVYIAKSKTDQLGEGAEVAVLAKNHAPTDPVRLLQAWVALLAERGITEGPLLRSVDRWGNIAGGLTGEGVNRIVKRLAEAACLPNPDGYSGHSMRAGGATEAHRAGAPLQAIADLGRWRSDAVTRYIRAVDQWRDHPMRNVGL